MIEQIHVTADKEFLLSKNTPANYILFKIALNAYCEFLEA